MGLVAPVAELFFAENAYKPINGDVGFIGRQTTYLRAQSLEHLSKLYNFVPQNDFCIEIDTDTLLNSRFGGNFITDKCLINYFGDGRYKAIDVSDYEGADIVCDLCGAIPEELHNSFDFVYDGSCLDNVFNPAAALCNISRLLRPGGRVILANHATWFNGPYTIFSPGWFFDYFVANGYDDCQVFVGVFQNNEDLAFGRMPLCYYNWASGEKDGATPTVNEGGHILLIVLAEKGKKSTNDVNPVQRQYRDKIYDESIFKNNAEHILRSPRRLFSLQNDVSMNKTAYIPLLNLAEGLPF